MALEDTIVAVSSAPGVSARAVVRASGPLVEVLAGRFEPGIPPRRGAFISRLPLAEGTLRLPVLVLRAVAPRSYTGEDTLEVLVPGNPTLVDRVMGTLLSEPGVRPAQPGEFSARAYLHGKLTLEEAEGVAATIAAESAEQLEAARDLAAGRTGNDYRGVADELTTLRALVEAGIDFTDQEDVQPIAPAALATRLTRLEDVLRGLVRPSAGEVKEPHRPRVALVGAPNAGKSTLFNALLGRRRAVVSPVAGTTRDVITEALDLSRDLPGAEAVDLADMAGLDGADRGAPDRAGQESARRFAREAEVLLHCDPSGRFAPEIVGSARGRVLRVRTKADVPGSGPGGDLAVCALDGWNLPLLRRAIADASFGSRSSAAGFLLPRHRRCLTLALGPIAAARRMVDLEAPGLSEPALVAERLREAAEAMDELVGRVAPDDVLGRIFSTFCVGK